MKHESKILIGSLSIFFLWFMLTGKVLATQTSWYHANNVVQGGASYFTNATYSAVLATDSDTTDAPVGWSSYHLRYSGMDWSTIPWNATLVSFKAYVTYQNTRTINGSDVQLVVHDGSCAGGCNPSSCTYTANTDGSYCKRYLQTPSENVTLKTTIAQNNGAQSIDLESLRQGNYWFDVQGLIDGGNSMPKFDEIKFAVEYTTPVASLDTFTLTASGSSGIATLNFDGHTGCDTHVSTRAKVSVFRLFRRATSQDIWSNESASFYTIEVSNVPPLPSATTQISPDYYVGYGYTSSDDSYHAHGLVMRDYNPTNDYMFKTHITCEHYDGDGNIIIDKENENMVDPAIIATASATVAYQECATGDLICQSFNDFKSFLSDLFSPSYVDNEAYISDIRNSISTHAPFSYVYQVASFNYDFSGGSTDLPSIDFPYYNGTEVTSTQIITPTEISSFVSGIKTIEAIILWGITVAGVVIVGKRIL